MKKDKIITVFIFLLFLGALTGIIVSALKRGAKNIKDTEDNNTSAGDGGSISAPPGTSLSNPPSISNPPAQAQPKYTIGDVRALVPTSIAGSLGLLNADQWNNITALINKLPDSKFQDLKQQIDGIGTFQAIVINNMATETLYNAIISKLQS